MPVQHLNRLHRICTTAHVLPFWEGRVRRLSALNPSFELFPVSITFSVVMCNDWLQNSSSEEMTLFVRVRFCSRKIHERAKIWRWISRGWKMAYSQLSVSQSCAEYDRLNTFCAIPTLPLDTHFTVAVSPPPHPPHFYTWLQIGSDVDAQLAPGRRLCRQTMDLIIRSCARLCWDGKRAAGVGENVAKRESAACHLDVKVIPQKQIQIVLTNRYGRTYTMITTLLEWNYGMQSISYLCGFSRQ